MKKILVNVDFGNNQAKNLLLDNSSGDPSGVVDSQVWYDTGTKQFMMRRNGISEINCALDDMDGINYVASRGGLGN